jgi:hypothetical protein
VGQAVITMTLYACRRKRGPSAGDDGEYTYEFWVVAEARPLAAVDAAASELLIDPRLSAESARKLGDDLRKAIVKVTADRVEQMAWKIDDVPERQAADLIASLPESLQSLADRPLEDLAVTAGMPAAAASLSADVVGAVAMRAVVEPVEKAMHGLEVAVLVLALLTGTMHSLAIICIKHLAYDKLGDMMSDGFARVIGAATEALGPQPSATAAVEAAGEVTGPATASPPSWADLAAANREPAAPHGTVPTVAGTAAREARGMQDPGRAVVVSPENQRRLRRLIEVGMISGGEQDTASVTDHREIAKHSPAEILQDPAADIDNPPPLSDLSSGMTAI